MRFGDVAKALLRRPAPPAPDGQLPDPRPVVIPGPDGQQQLWEITVLELSPDGRLHIWLHPLARHLIEAGGVAVVSGTCTADGVHLERDDPDSVTSSDEDPHLHAALCAAVQPRLKSLRQLHRLLADAHHSALFRAGRSYAPSDIAEATRLGVLLDVYAHRDRDVRATALAMLAATTIDASPHSSGPQVLAAAEAATRP